MKELLIEEKARRYDEAVAMAKECITYISDEAVNKYMLNMFPELKENKDEKIRKALINVFATHKDYEIFFGVSVENIIAWLEKQNELSIKWNKNTEDNKPSVNHSILMKTTHGIAEGERKGESWYQYRWKTHVKDSDVLAWMELSDLDERDKSVLETINEEKVELKYKDGDWIVYENNVYKIVNIPHDNSYECLGIDNTIRVYNHLIDNKSHLWSIEDAREGDVLCTYECGKPKIVFILKGTVKKHRALSYHCYYNLMYPCFKTDSEIGCLAPNEEDVKPATREQRDLLFQKMKEVGYERNESSKGTK